MTEFLQSRDNIFMGKELLLVDEQGKWFLEVESSGEDAMKIAEMTRDLEYYLNLVDNATTGFERIDSSFEGSSPVHKVLLSSVARYSKIISEKKSQ